MTRSRKQPVRTCIGCGLSTDKRDLVRVVRSPEGDVELDVSGKANGRGAYVCARDECFETAVRKRKINAALRVSLKDDDVDRLKRDFDGVPKSASRQGE